MHVWVAAGHTLCELETGDYLTDHLEEIAAVDAPVCGPCLMIVARLRRQACALLDLAGGEVAPERPSDSWRLLAKSGWGSRLDIAPFLKAHPDLDTESRNDSVRYEVDPASVRDLVREMLDARAMARGSR